MTTPTVTDILSNMRTTIGTPATWTKGFSARTAAGDACDPCSPAAASWCMSGAMERELGRLSDQELRDELCEATTHTILVVCHQELGRDELQELAPYNDGRFTTHADVLDLLSRARLRVSARSSHS